MASVSRSAFLSSSRWATYPPRTSLRPSRATRCVHRTAMSTPFSVSEGEILLFFRALDRPNSASLRAENRPAHLRWVTEQPARVYLGGPILGEEGPHGSVLLLKARDDEALRSWLQRDPYVTAGVFGSVETTSWKLVQEPSKNWTAKAGEEVTVVVAVDKSIGVEGLRAATRADHLQWWGESGKSGWLGPLLKEDGVPKGTLLVLRNEDGANLTSWLESDPYAKAGLFDRVEVFRQKLVIARGAELATPKI